jgi:hypothetical protein
VFDIIATTNYMSQAVPPSSLAEGALVMQFCLSIIMALGARWVSKHEWWNYRFYNIRPSPARFAWTLFIFTLFPVGLLIFSDAFASTTQPLFGTLPMAFLRWQTALLWVFLIDIGCVAFLVKSSGGSYRSPFTPVFFILPAMAFFLREPAGHVVTYLITTGLFFTWGLSGDSDNRGKAEQPVAAYWLVSVACLLLSGFIGYLTRPR